MKTIQLSERELSIIFSLMAPPYRAEDIRSDEFNELRNKVFYALRDAKNGEPVSDAYKLPGRWIPVSERVPESNGVYFGWDGKRVLEVNCFFGGFSANQFIHGEITHWMPLPAAPQEVPDGKV